MADFRALGTVAEAVLHLLRSQHRRQDFGHDLEFKVFTAKDFARPLQAGVSLFLYRIFPNGVQRTPAAPASPDGRRQPSLLPLELHFILTVWGQEASLQHTIAGWAMRVLEDRPNLPASLLNAVTPDVFRPDETVQVSLTELTNEDLLRIWDTLVQNVYQLSIPYVARVVRIESRERPEADGPEVQERLHQAALLEVPGAEAFR